MEHSKTLTNALPWDSVVAVRIPKASGIGANNLYHAVPTIWAKKYLSTFYPKAVMVSPHVCGDHVLSAAADGGLRVNGFLGLLPPGTIGVPQAV